MNPPPSVPAAIVDEAARWLVKVAEAPLDPAEQRRLDAWRGQSSQHERAWQAALRFRGMIGSVPASLGKRVWGRARLDRRAALKGLAGLAVLIPTGRIAWQQWPALQADYWTAPGERRRVALPDGSELHLNSATVADIRFSETERLIRLVSGEILITTASDSTALEPPFVVETRAGRVRALGTRFSVRDMGAGEIEVSVFEHAVLVQPDLQAGSIRVDAGQTLRFDRAAGSSPRPQHQPAPAWASGRIIADDQRLGDFLAELARHRPGLLRCDPAVAELRISGVYLLDDTDQVLNILADTLPIRISRVSDYWVTVGPR